MLYTRIYHSLIKNSLKSDKRLYYTLSYLKLRTIASNRAGFFSFGEAKKTLELSSKTVASHLKHLSSDGILIPVDGGYLLKDERKVSVYGTSLRSKSYIVIESSDLFKYSWKNISFFRAYFSELRIEKDKSAIQKVGNGFSVKPRDGGKTIRIKNEELLALIPYYSYLRSSKTNECSISTAKRYRKKQDVAEYKHKVEKLITFNRKTSLVYGSAYLQQQKLIDIKVGKILRDENFLPYAFSPPSTRVSKLKSRTKEVSDYQFAIMMAKIKKENEQKKLPVY